PDLDSRGDRGGEFGGGVDREQVDAAGKVGRIEREVRRQRGHRERCDGGRHRHPRAVVFHRVVGGRAVGADQDVVELAAPILRRSAGGDRGGGGRVAHRNERLERRGHRLLGGRDRQRARG